MSRESDFGAELLFSEEVEKAEAGLRGWRNAGEHAANKGQNFLMPLDAHVDIALDELAHRKDAEAAVGEEIERPDHEQLDRALKGLKQNFVDPVLGPDLKTICRTLELTAAE